MPLVFLPVPARDLTGGVDRCELDAGSVRQAIGLLEERFPGIRDRLLDEQGELKPGMRVTVDGHVSSLGLLARLDANSEVHFLPAIGGG